MPDDLVTIRGFEFLHEAEAARMCLEAEGIQAFLADAETVNMDWGLGNAVGYIKLQVPTSQSDRAAETLTRFVTAHAGRAAMSDDAGACLACGADIPATSPRCPACGWSYAADEDVSPDKSTTDEDSAVGEAGIPSTTDRLKSLKRPVFLILLAPTFLGIGFLGIFILVKIILLFVG
jgi:hypothetical protein